jgi:hypothetical protein
MKHTPGPWTIEKAGDGKFYVQGNRNGERCIIAMDFYDEENEPDLEELKANVHLITAAPDLLEACKLVMVTSQTCFADILKLGHIQPPNGNDYRKAKDIARQAIAKAEGR